MEPVIRGLAVYIFLLIILRISGKRTMAEATAFDVVLLLIISETTQEAMIDSDHSFTNAAILITTLIGADIFLSLAKMKIPFFDPFIDGTAVILMRDGQLLRDRMKRERVDVNDLLEAARQQQGLENLDQIRLAVLERDGQISIVPKT